MMKSLWVWVTPQNEHFVEDLKSNQHDFTVLTIDDLDILAGASISEAFHEILQKDLDALLIIESCYSDLFLDFSEDLLRRVIPVFGKSPASVSDITLVRRIQITGIRELPNRKRETLDRLLFLQMSLDDMSAVLKKIKEVSV